MTYSLIATGPTGNKSVHLITESAVSVLEVKNHKAKCFGSEGWVYGIQKTTDAHRAELAALPRA